MPTARDSRSRRTFAHLAAVAGSWMLAGCAGLEAPTGIDRPQLTDARRERILDRYAVGRAARRAASGHWTRGRDAWQYDFYREAAAEWSAAGQRFTESYRQFAHAGRDCREANAERAREVCADARDYCAHMRSSAEAHARAAEAYVADDPEAGGEHLDRAWTHYRSALDHEVRSPDHLETALSADRRETDG